jgi:hypothetical protein
MAASMAQRLMLGLVLEQAMHNHCACCYGKFGLVRHRRIAFGPRA